MPNRYAREGSSYADPDVLKADREGLLEIRGIRHELDMVLDGRDQHFIPYFSGESSRSPWDVHMSSFQGKTVILGADGIGFVSLDTEARTERTDSDSNSGQD